MVSSTYTFDIRRDYDTTSDAGGQIFKENDLDLISLLAVAQKLQVSFLTITWQTALDNVAIGGTSSIKEGLLSRERSIAFKKLKGDDKEDHERAYRLLINELSVLGNAAVLAHRNILDLVGISWDISSDEEVWPAFVFEKSPFGDLKNFASLPVAKNMNLMERVGICVDIGVAIADMHWNHIIHGDMKPENVIIFQEATGEYTAKVMDFGYSSHYASQTERIFIPESQPWTAPEYKPAENLSRKYLPDEAALMDIFSFGLVCVWFIFEAYFAGISALPEELGWAKKVFLQNERPRPLGRIIDDLKKQERLIQVAWDLLQANSGSFDHATFVNLHTFFGDALAVDTHHRRAGIALFIETVNFHRVNRSVMKIDDDRFDTLTATFDITASSLALYSIDYRVRTAIAKCFQKRVLSRSTRDTSSRHNSLQLALCYTLGFGIPRNEVEANELLESPDESGELNKLISTLRTTNSRETSNSRWVEIREGGSTNHLHYLEQLQTPEESQRTVKRLENELRDLASVVKEAPILAQLQQALSRIYSHAGEWKKAIEMQKTVCDYWVKVFGKEESLTAYSIGLLASLYRSQGLWKESEELGKESLDLASSIHGDSHLITLEEMANLSMTYMSQGKWNEAEKLLRHVMETESGVLGSNHPKTLNTLVALSSTLRSLGKYEEARDLGAQALNDMIFMYGEEHPDTLNCKANLGLAYYHLKRWKESQECLEDVILIKEKILGRRHPSTLTDLSNLASLYWFQGKEKDAEKIETEVSEASKEVQGIDHPETLMSLANLATTWWKLGKWDQTERLEEKILETRKRLNGIDHPETLNGMANLAATYCSLGKWDMAQELLLEVIERRREILGEEHPDTILGIVNLGASYSQQGQVELAEVIEEHALELRMKLFGVDNPDTLNSMANLATTYRKQNKLEKALELEEQVLEKRKALLGKTHSSTLNAMSNLGLTCWALGKYAEAAIIEGLALKLRIDHQGPKHPDTLTSMHNLACTWKSQGRDAEALKMMEAVARHRQEVLGPTHPDTLTSLEALQDFRKEAEEKGTV
ncbi:TPR-like protein [Lindgomyces ingoldianus]|uniref:TPR-like protein n=1 Tax=Lindgomyces ingoldianus TaxID=673940 RepID=A0ACB6QQY5_9PLEO|nr:TPR-like protein [Lindgomyces ingoldianus]KAF2468702.1 TPR-like protein [Lindgomyces ingoldianus]